MYLNLLRSLKPVHYIITGVSVVFTLTLIFIYSSDSAGAGSQEPISVDPEFSKYITAYSSGTMSSGDPIQIRLARSKDSVELYQPIDKKLFDFDPGVDGKAYWVKNNTIEFRPESNLPNGKRFEVTFYVSKVMDVDEEKFETLRFSFNVMPQNYEVAVKGLVTPDNQELQNVEVEGWITTADVAATENIEKGLRAYQDDRELELVWKHDAKKRKHRFLVKGVKRENQQKSVSLIFNGKALDLQENFKKEVSIPALGDFKLMKSKVMQSPQQYLLLQFSDPLKEDQDLRGLINITSLDELSYSIEGNNIKVYPQSRVDGSYKVTVNEGVRNVLDYKMGEREVLNVTFEQIKPDVRFVGDGVIMPGREKVMLPFEAVNLNAVDVQISKVFKNNIVQFLQVNDLDGNRALRRVAKPVVQKTVSLKNSGVVNFGKWNRFSLDISELIDREPGTIYQVEIGFRKSHSTYGCGDQNTEEEEDNMNGMQWRDEDAYWDSFHDYRYGRYDYHERDNPCHGAYYGGRNIVKRNILSSDLGLMAKRGKTGKILCVVTDLKTAKPISGADITLYNYQQQKIKEAATNEKGIVQIPFQDDEPFVVAADYEGQKGYLKVDDGSALSMSNFNVGGEKVQKGVKGFMYTERGVWRPGDSLFVSFMLEDKHDNIPDNHPVTFKLYNPRRQMVKKMVKTSSTEGLYTFRTRTSPDAPTGNWRGVVHVGGAKFGKILRIETVKPNRLKIDLDFGADKITTANAQLKGDLTVEWLHGATAGNLKGSFEVYLTQATTTFDKYPDFVFDDKARDFDPEKLSVFEGYVDEQGKAMINADLSVSGNPPGMLAAQFKGEVFEKSGNSSVTRFTLPYYPYSKFTGIKVPEGEGWNGSLNSKESHSMPVVSVNDDGEAVSSRVEVELYKMDWRWWWDNRGENLDYYIGKGYKDPVKKDYVNTTNGKGIYELQLDNPEWGRYYVRACDTESGHCTGKMVYFSWPGRRNALANKGDAATMLSFKSSQEKYETGETAELIIPSAHQGRALVSIENGAKVIQREWLEVEKGKTHYEFAVTPEMAPNIYAHVTLIQPHSGLENDRPIRLYGVIPIMVENPETVLTPELEMPDELKPQQDFTIEVNEADNKPMAYTIAMVDEGLLDLTNFQTPQPHEVFYAREALGVKTFDLFNDVMGAYDGELKNILSIGGDKALNRKKEDERADRFEPVVKFLGPFFLEGGKRRKHTIKLPEYIGSVRTMLVAGYNGAYGAVDKTTKVRKSLMVLGSMPRVLGPGEEVMLPVNVFAMKDGVDRVNVRVKTNDILTFDGPSTQTINFDKPGEKMTYFSLKVKERVGIADLEIVAASQGNKARHKIELDVRNPNPRVTETDEKVIEGGQSWTASYEPVGITGTNSGKVELSSMPPLNLEKRLKFLKRYPHGCIEQTTSSVFPQLFLSNLMDLSSSDKSDIEYNIKAGIQKLMKFQVANGGLGYWPGADHSSSWGTSYGGHFLIEAKNAGYNVPDNFLDQLLSFQKTEAKNWRPGRDYTRNDLIQAYRLYMLALAGEAELGAMNRLREQNDLSKQGTWRLAAAYALAGKKGVASSIVSNVDAEVDQYNEMAHTYGSSLRDKAMIMETMTLLDDRQEAGQLVKHISERLSQDNRWYSTQTTAYCLLAVAKFTGNAKDNEKLDYEIKIDEKGWQSEKSNAPMAIKDIGLDDLSSGKIQVKNNSSKTLFAKLVLQGIPATGDVEESSSNLNMQVKYKDMDGEMINPARLEQGTDFMAEVTVENPKSWKDYEEMALTQVFPSGWEITNTRLDNTTDFNQLSEPEYQDIRDDRVYTYFDLNENEQKTFRILLNANFEGRFYLAPVYCEAMYDNTVNAKKPGMWVNVIKPGDN